MKDFVFKVGDIVNVEPSVGLHYSQHKNLRVVDSAELDGLYFGIQKVSIEYVNEFPEEFVLVKRVDDNDDIDTGDEPEGMEDFIRDVREKMEVSMAIQPSGFFGRPLTLPGAYLNVPDNSPTIVETNLEDTPRHEPEQLGIYRPDLKTRKAGKVGMHMFIDGFPNAMYEVARVMTWAAEKKGYKLHDWKNLPDAEDALSSAGYRHLVDNAVQRAAGIVPADRVDHESELLHLAHLAFNILAQIELIKTGKIQ